mgnify:CR=1 FL=1
MKINNQEDCDLSESFLYYNARHLDENGSVIEVVFDAEDSFILEDLLADE